MTPEEMENRGSAWLNAPVYQPGATNHLESFFFKANDPETARAVWVKFTVFAPRDDAGAAVGEAWIVCFDGRTGRVTGAKESHPIAECEVSDAPRVRVGASGFEEGRTWGRLEDADGGVFSWDLRYDPASRPLVPYPWGWMYRARLPKTKTVTPHPDLRMDGEVALPEETWSFATAPAMQGHNWGTEHAHRYAWVHANAFEELDHAVFEGFSARLKIGPWVTPSISGGFLLLPDGTRHAFNDLVGMVRTEAAVEDAAYTFTYLNRTHRLEGEVRTTPERMAGLYYRNPDGAVHHCLNSKISDLTLRLTDRSGREELHLTCPGAAALETFTVRSDHPVEMIL